jgi:hypothetical protein
MELNDIYVFDDFIPKSYQDGIEFVSFNLFRWKFVKDITIPSNNLEFSKIKPAPGLIYHLYDRGNVMSDQHSYFLPMIYMALENTNIKFKNVQLGRSFLQFPLNKSFNRIDPLHVDSNLDHLVVLYYVLDSDGDTLITNTRRTETYVKDGMLVEDHEIIKRVTPKKGRVVLFDGKLYHTAEQPLEDIRCVINYNVTI